jgi:hypothetical protein
MSRRAEVVPRQLAAAALDHLPAALAPRGDTSGDLRRRTLRFRSLARENVRVAGADFPFYSIKGDAA